MPLLRRRRGSAAILAMLFLVLLATLAVGFSAGVGTNMQVAGNDRRINEAMLAAESGMSFLRHKLAQVMIPPGTPDDEMLEELEEDLVFLLEDTPNLTGANGRALNVAILDGALLVPYEAGEHIRSTGHGARFRAAIAAEGPDVLVAVTGLDSTGEVTRTIQIRYRARERSRSVFDYAIASRSKITIGNNTTVTGTPQASIATILSTTMSDAFPVELAGNKSVVGGGISITNPDADVAYVRGRSSIGGTTDPATIENTHVHKGVPEPEFPAIDFERFATYATNRWPTKTLGAYENCYVPPGSNPTFSGGDIIRGVLYVHPDNHVTFRGSVTIQGMIVCATDSRYDIDDNILDFSGNVTVRGVETLDPRFGELRTMTGSFILAPTFHVDCGGSFGAVNGSIIASRVTIDGSADMTINGSIVNLDEHPVVISPSASSPVIFVGTAADNPPVGVRFSSNFHPVSSSYVELSE